MLTSGGGTRSLAPMHNLRQHGSVARALLLALILAACLPAVAGASSGAWERWTELLERQPILLGGVAALILVLLTIPFFGMRLGQSDAGTDPTTSTTYKAYQLLAKGFGPGYNGPFQFVAVVSTPGGSDRHL